MQQHAFAGASTWADKAWQGRILLGEPTCTYTNGINGVYINLHYIYNNIIYSILFLAHNLSYNWQCLAIMGKTPKAVVAIIPIYFRFGTPCV